MVQEHRGDYPSQWAAIESIALQIGGVSQTLNEWVKRAEVDTCARESITTSEARRMKELDRLLLVGSLGCCRFRRHQPKLLELLRTLSD